MEEFSLCPACISQTRKPPSYHILCNRLNQLDYQAFPQTGHYLDLLPLGLGLLSYNDVLGVTATKPGCPEFQRAEMSGRVSVNDANCVKYWATATELPQMIGKDGMKIIYKKLMELEEQLGLTRNYDPSCVAILQSAIRSFSA